MNYNEYILLLILSNFSTEGSFWSVSLNANGVVISLITEYGETFSGVDGAFKLFVEKLIPIHDLPY